MTHFVGLDVSVKETSVCVVDDAGKVVCERKVPTEPDDIAVLLTSVGGDYERKGQQRASVAPNVVSVSRSMGFPHRSVSRNVSRKLPFIAVPASHHCEPPQITARSSQASGHAGPAAHDVRRMPADGIVSVSRRGKTGFFQGSLTI
ncbi:transposase [Sphingomonas sp. PAMC 26621]|uniref:transposase n=1 Tax=Sphingomonas sp. PAMC 26621 TaxID=1112213 RepID=UPI0002896491|nr:transposase [Sphingomonas sp. PAMC 26621]